MKSHKSPQIVVEHLPRRVEVIRTANVEWDLQKEAHTNLMVRCPQTFGYIVYLHRSVFAFELFFSVYICVCVCVRVLVCLYTHSVPKEDFGDRIIHRVLYVSPFKEEDLHKEFRCSVQYGKVFHSRIVTLEEEVYIPSIELGWGLGLTLILALLLFVLYRVFWLEVHLLYRSWFGTDERDMDNKEYDVYISYARNTEEEEFVLATLRRVLEAEFGYTVCIFDRDSLPGGTVTEETLQFVSRSRRLLVILSACSAFRDAQALLEVRAGVSAMLHGGSIKLVLIQLKESRATRDKSHKPDAHQCVKELRRARIALALVQWEGEKSSSLTSHFWKKLQLQLPVRTPTHTTKPAQVTSYTDEKQKSESAMLMLESMPDTHLHKATYKHIS